MLDTCCGGWNEWDQAVRACVHGSALCSLWRSRARLHIEETGQHKQKCPRCIIYPTTLDMRVLQHSTQFFVLQEWQNKRIEGVIVCLQYERARFAFSSVQFWLLSQVRLFATPWTAACQASLSITNSQSLLKLMSTESVMLSNHLILCCPLLLPPLIFPSIRVFSNESALGITWLKYWSFSFSISPSNRIDFL